MARFSASRRRAIRRAAASLEGEGLQSGSHPQRPGRSHRSRALANRGRAVVTLALTLAAAVLLLRAGNTFLTGLGARPFASTGNQQNSEDPNSLPALARDYYSAYQGTPPPPLKVGAPIAARFGLLAPRAVGAPDVTPVAGNALSVGSFAGGGGLDGDVARPLGSGSGNNGGPLAPLPLLTVGGPTVGSSGSGELAFGLGALPQIQVVALDEIAARRAANVRQTTLLDRFLRTARVREATALQSDVTEAQRSLADAVRAAGQLDLGPLPIDLPDAEIQLEMTNLRLKLSPGLRLAPGEKEKAALRLQQLEAEWNARLATQREARSEEIERLRNERPRAVNEAGTQQLEADLRAAQARNARERQQLAEQLQNALRRDASQPSLSLVLPSTSGASRIRPTRTPTPRQIRPQVKP